MENTYLKNKAKIKINNYKNEKSHQQKKSKKTGGLNKKITKNK